MGLRKFNAEQLFDGYRFRNEKEVLITTDDGSFVDIIAHADAGDDIEPVGGILSPGFINCHVHLELSHMLGQIPEKTGLVDFVVDIVQKRHSPEEEILLAIEKAEDEMLMNGIVAAGDICNNTLTIPQKSKGRVYYHNFIEASGFDPAIAEQRFERTVDIFNAYAKNYSIPIESNSIVPHAPYSVSDMLWEMIIQFPGNHVMTIHNQETAGENEWFMKKTGALSSLYKKLNIDDSFFAAAGKSSLESYLGKFNRNQSVILVHNVHTQESDIRYACSPSVKCKLFWCLCPNANRYISEQLPPADLFLKNECDIVLGTDSLASNHQLSILAEIKTIRENFPAIELETMLKWATSNGARALQMDQLLGSFEKNKRPGIIAIDPQAWSAKRIL